MVSILQTAQRRATVALAAALGALALALSLAAATPAHAWAGEALDADVPAASSIASADDDGLSPQASVTMVSALNVDISYRYDYAFEVLRLVNQQRAAAGAAPLVMDQRLLDAAMKVRAPEVGLLYSHTRPDGSSCFTAASTSALGTYAGENIALGHSNPAAVVEAWMKSEGHQKNILNPNYTAIGIGCVTMGSYPCWVQLFSNVSPIAPASNPGNSTASSRLSVPSSWLVPRNFAFEYSGYSVKPGGTRQARVGFLNQTDREAGCVMLKPSTFSWSSAKTSIATVNASGLITGKASGVTTISAKLGNYLTVSAAVETQGKTGTWKKTGGKWWFQLGNGSYPYNAWCQIDGDWYHFDRSGYMQTGWFKEGRNWYYLKSSGVMAIGWQKIGGTWYYFKTSGIMLTGWQKISGSWYYFNSSGAMLSGRWVGNSYLYTSGVMATDAWIGRYHVNANGIWDKTR